MRCPCRRHRRLQLGFTPGPEAEEWTVERDGKIHGVVVVATPHLTHDVAGYHLMVRVDDDLRIEDFVRATARVDHQCAIRKAPRKRDHAQAGALRGCQLHVDAVVKRHTVGARRSGLVGV